MASQNLDRMISIGGRCWSFSGTQIEMCSSEFEWRDGKLWLHESTGNVIEGTEVSDGTTEQFLREVQLAGVLELAAASPQRSADPRCRPLFTAYLLD
jgi:hypothetical protein